MPFKFSLHLHDVLCGYYTLHQSSHTLVSLNMLAVVWQARLYCVELEWGSTKFQNLSSTRHYRQFSFSVIFLFTNCHPFISCIEKHYSRQIFLIINKERSAISFRYSPWDTLAIKKIHMHCQIKYVSSLIGQNTYERNSFQYLIKQRFGEWEHDGHCCLGMLISLIVKTYKFRCIWEYWPNFLKHQSAKEESS